MAEGPTMLPTITDGQSGEVPLVGRNKRLRFAVGRLGHQSLVFNVWTGSGSKADVYCAARDAAQEWKFSLHESGVWRYAETQDFTGRLGPTPRLDPDDRVIRRWQRPSSGRDWIHGLTLMFPHGYLGHFHYGETEPRPTLWLTAPAPAMVTVVSLGICYGKIVPFACGGGATVVGGLALGGGGAVALASYSQPLDPENSPILEGFIRDAVRNLQPVVSAMGRPAVPHVFGIVEDLPTPMVWVLSGDRWISPEGPPEP